MGMGFLSLHYVRFWNLVCTAVLHIHLSAFPSKNAQSIPKAFSVLIWLLVLIFKKKKCTPKSLQGNLDFLLNIQVLYVYTWKGHTMIFTSVSLLLHFCFCYCHPFYVTFKMICFVMKRMMQTDECLLQK